MIISAVNGRKRILPRAACLFALLLFLFAGSVRAKAAAPSRRIILIGDSRTEMMREYGSKDARVIWSYASGKGLSWAKQTGVPRIESKIRSNTAVVILLGLNDCADTWMADRYASYFNKKAAEWKKKGASTYFFSVGPVDDAKAKASKSERAYMITSFNKALRAKLSSDVQYVDIYSALQKNLSTLHDGIHYKKSSSDRYFSLIISKTAAGSSSVSKTSSDPDSMVSRYYKPVYNFRDFMKYNPSLKKTYGSNPSGAYHYFLKKGMKKGLRASSSFDAVSYALRYGYLRHIYGTSDWTRYYTHYLNKGKARGMSGAWTRKVKGYETVYKGRDYARVYNYNDYIKCYPSVFRVYGYNDKKVLAHFVKYGIRSGWIGCSSFNWKTYKVSNRDLAKKFGRSVWKYYDHYLRKGYRQSWRRHV